MFQALKEVVFPRGFFGIAARVFGAFSLLSLLELALSNLLGFPFSLPFQNILDYYDLAVVYLLQWAEPYILLIVGWLSDIFDIELVLFSHWRHITVVIGLYFSRSVWIAFGNDVGAALFRLGEAVVLALAAGVAAGLVPLSSDMFFANFIVAAVPILALYLYGVINGIYQMIFAFELERTRYDSVNTRVDVFLGHAKAAWSRSWLGFAILIAGMAALHYFDVPNSGLLMLTVLALSLSLYFLADGRRQARSKNSKSWPELFWSMDSSRLGGAMLGVLAWDAILVLVDFLAGQIWPT